LTGYYYAKSYWLPDVIPIASVLSHKMRLQPEFAGCEVVDGAVAEALFRRLRNHENVFAAHRSHLYQRLVVAGYHHRTITLLYVGLAAAGVILALLWTHDAAGSGLAIVLSIPLLCWGLCRVVWRRERLRKPP